VDNPCLAGGLEVESATVFGTLNCFFLEPLIVALEKTCAKSMVGVTGFEPATPTSRTPEELSENNDLGGPE
jgi:hypothetical protein